MTASPLVRVAYRFAREFGWTFQQMQEMTMAQITLYEQLLAEDLSKQDQSGGRP